MYCAAGSVRSEEPSSATFPADAHGGAGMRACRALLDAFDPACSVLERRASMLGALELAMEATGCSRTDAIALLAQWCQELRS